MVVDFCAGAGGKTLALGAQMRNTGRLYAFDVSGHRLAALKPRLARSGLANVHPAQIAHERDDRVKRLAGKIDRVLVDAPCSGSGTLRRNPDLKWRQSADSLAALVPTQTAILAAAARLVKPGGRLVYATCSVLEAEGEAVAREFDVASSERIRSRAGRRGVAAGACRRRRDARQRRRTFVSGRIAMQPMVSSPRSGSVVELRATGRQISEYRAISVGF